MHISKRDRKRLNNWLELSLKAIPIFLAVFLIGNVLFNISYFSSVQFEWSSLLTISDYYEGSILYIAYALLVFLLVSGLYLFQKKGMGSIKELISYFWKTVVLMFSAVIIVFLYIYLGIIRITMVKKEKLTFHIKRKYIKLLKSIKSAWKLVCKQFFLHITVLISLLFISIFLLILIIIIMHTLYLYNWLSLVFAAAIYINFLLLINRSPSLWKIVFICITIYWYTMWSLGGFTARPNPGYELPFLKFLSHQGLTLVATFQKQDFILVRAINKGVIVRDNDDLYFFKWEDVKYLRKQKVEKQEKTDAKK